MDQRIAQELEEHQEEEVVEDQNQDQDHRMNLK